ncbi:MAG TPA: hypothetical protein VFS12_17805 [Terriglobia bacterium]|nr:hypothetical protein [Terriglobia bacterium]
MNLPTVIRLFRIWFDNDSLNLRRVFGKLLINNPFPVWLKNGIQGRTHVPCRQPLILRFQRS